MDSPLLAPLPPARVAEAAAILSRAFVDDAGFVYTLPDAARRPAQLAWLFDRILRISHRCGEVEALTEGDALTTIVAWMPPRGEPGLWDLVRGGLLQLPFRFGLSGARRMGHCLTAMDRSKAELLGSRPHWYLDQLAVEPARQGQGLGRAAVRQGIEARLAREALPLFLFTSNPRNVPFYEGAGFAVLRREWVGEPGDGFWLWAMLREP
jgi:ribosomal protein S18 acetylase RimI-like enzyme